MSATDELAPKETSLTPRILLLDDEYSQRISVRLQLQGMGTFIEYDDPRPALEYLRANRVDVAIVDIRMPTLPVDGIWFMEEFRRFDSVTSVIIRTADDDVTIADAGLQARAIRRVIKAHVNSPSILRQTTTLAIEETRARRRTNQDAAAAVRTRNELVTALARTDDHITVAEMCRGFTLGLINQITALTGFAELLTQQPTTPEQFQDLALKNRAIVDRLRAHVTEFLRNPFVDGMVNALTTASVNECVAALEQILARHPAITDRDLKFTARGSAPDAIFSANPSRTITALRHLVEYAALNSANASELTLSANLEQNPKARIDASKPGHFVLNGRWVSRKACVAFTVRVQLRDVTVEKLHSDLRSCSDNPRTANLLMLSTAVVDDHLVFEASLADKGYSTLSVYIPIAGA